MENAKIFFNLTELQPLRDKIVASIRDSIIDGRLQPGERLIEPDTAKMLGVSRTPIREAFLQLESEGFVKVVPRKGAIVTELSLRDALETYDIKSELEALAAKLSVENITDNQIEELKTLNIEMDRQSKLKKKNYKLFLELNSRFHQIIIKASGNEKLYRLICQLRRQTLRYNYLYLSLLSHLDNTVSEHNQIIEALKKRDARKTEMLIRKHGDTARKALCDYMNIKPLATI